MVKVGINGFGRIGRLILRAILENYKNKIQVVAINDLGSIETNAHLIKYDSTHGIINEDIQTSNDGFKISNQNIKVFAERDPVNIPWDKVDNYKDLKTHAESLGVSIGAVNPNLFQDDDYKFGSLTNTDPSIRRKALDHLLECIDIAL